MTFWRNWFNKLRGKTAPQSTDTDYERLLQKLLQATSASGGDSAAVYPLLQENVERINLELAQTIPTFARNHWTSDTIINLFNLGNAIQQFPLGERALNLEIALVIYQVALDFFPQETSPTEWATIQNSLAVAYLYRIQGERGENIEQAIACYEAALQVYTRESLPQYWALTQENIAYAYIDLENHSEAIKYFKAALEVLTPASFPLNALKAGRNLGNLGYDRQDWETALFGYDQAIRAVEQSRTWATSPLPQTPKPLHEHFPEGVRYAPSSQILERLHQRRQRPTTGAFFAIQNPTQDLPYTNLEVELIRRRFDPNTRILKHQQADKTTLQSADILAQLRQSLFLHFACHAGFDSQNPLNSALILAGGAAPQGYGRSTLTLRDGRRFDTESQGLTLREIYANLDLPLSRLVLLSACETGQVALDTTDEYIGLTSGFFFAGTPSVISSFWCVDDFATAFLSIRFYQEFTPQIPVAKALSQAQSWLRQASQKQLLDWCQHDLNFTSEDLDQFKFKLLDYDDPPFSDVRYWSAFGANGI
ncbi:CHAT domain-containing protein [Roseofilum capinflatum]|uniref:CHAT domain-containing protein n=1 Tax=Roseofilum capinflatum BLCC-M114 TaxID=3022440 RepID=A0ABT7B8H9_9CYAN|nr:CHAT domain-containing tetratricopeptide repeat protein [Roseofilum capinflatum]MDJ1175465.1 CHAT domain-containing protein [Roseofilum capinflatum BLCC-M114]